MLGREGVYILLSLEKAARQAVADSDLLLASHVFQHLLEFAELKFTLDLTVGTTSDLLLNMAVLG